MLTGDLRLVDVWSIIKELCAFLGTGAKMGAQLRPKLDSCLMQPTRTVKEREMATYFCYISSAVVSYMDKVYSIVRKTYDRKPMDEMEDLDVNAFIWRMFMNTTLQTAVHLGQDYDQNLRFVKNHFGSSLKKLCQETENLIKNQTAIIGVSMIDYGDHTWSATSLLA